MIQNAIIIRRTTSTKNELKTGATILQAGQWGFATNDKLLVVRDLTGTFHEIPCTDLLPDLLRVKEPVNDLLSLPEGSNGDLCLVKSESSYYYYFNSWTKLADSNQIASLISEQIALAITAHKSESDPHPQYILGTEIGQTIAPIESGKIPTSYLPSYVDDVLEYATLSNFPVIGEPSKIYIALDVNKIYRWGGSSYVEIASGGVALGETSSTAYRGDRGAISYTHSQTQGNPHGTTIADISGLQSSINAKMNTSDFPDIVAIEAISGTSGLLKKTAANTWTLDTNSYATTTQLTNGSVTKIGTANVGSATQPIYLSSGSPTACNTSVGSATIPTYSNAGVITACSTTLGVSITGNAATATSATSATTSTTATKLATARTIALSGDVTGSTTFDGSANVSISTTNNYQFDISESSSTVTDKFTRLAAWTPSAGITYSISFDLDHAGTNYAWTNKPFSAVIEYRDGTFNIQANMIGNHEGYSRLWYGMNGSVAEIWVSGYGESMRFKGKMTNQSSAMFSLSGSITLTKPTYLTDGGNVIRNATNADIIDGYHVVVQSLSTARTAPNTLFFCY